MSSFGRPVGLFVALLLLSLHLQTGAQEVPAADAGSRGAPAGNASAQQPDPLNSLAEASCANEVEGRCTQSATTPQPPPQPPLAEPSAASNATGSSNCTDAACEACEVDQATGAAVAQAADTAEAQVAAVAEAAAESVLEQASPAAFEAPAVPAPEPDEQKDFALQKDGAKVLAANKEAKKPQALLDDDSDTFVKNDCKADKWVVIELSQVAKINRVALAQYELYSSRVKEFEVRGRASHPRTDGWGSDYARGLQSSHWKLLGTFTAEKQKGLQVFTIEQPSWVRFVLLRFLTHYGSEPVCALNGVSLFGKSAVEELEEQLGLEDPGLDLLSSPAPAAEDGAPVLPPLVGSEAVALAAEQQPIAGRAAEPGMPATGQASQQQQQQQQQQVPPAVELPDTDRQQQEEGRGQQGSDPVQPPVANSTDMQPPEQHHEQHNTSALKAEAAEMPSGMAASPESKTTVAAASPSQAAEADHQEEAEAGASGPLVAAVAAAARGREVSSSVQQTPQTPGNLSAGAEASADAIGMQSNTSVAETPEQEQQLQDEARAAPPTNPAPPGSPSPPQHSAKPSQPPQQQEQEFQQQLDSILQQVRAAWKAGRDASNSGTVPERPPSPGKPHPAAAAAAAAAQAGSAPNGAAAGGGSATNGATAAAAGAGSAPNGAAASSTSDVSWDDLPILAAAKGAGGNFYDLLVQEIKRTKLQQNMLFKALAELKWNTSSQLAELTADVASLGDEISKVQREANLSDEQLVSRVDTLVKAHMMQVSLELAALHASMAGAAKREHALLSLLAMLGAIFALGSSKLADQWPRAKWLVVLLALANGAVGVLLHFASGAGHVPVLRALPWAS